MLDVTNISDDRVRPSRVKTYDNDVTHKCWALRSRLWKFFRDAEGRTTPIQGN